MAFYAVVEPLEGSNTLTETISVPTGKTIVVGGIRLYLHYNNCSAGTFSLSIKSGANTVWSTTFTQAQILAAYGGGNNYFGVWYSVTLDQDITLMEGEYTINLTDSSGYTFTDDTDYLGWVKPHENRYISTDYTVSGINKLPFGLEIWSYK